MKQQKQQTLFDLNPLPWELDDLEDRHMVTHGGIYFCILPDIEALGHDDEKPRCPWKGKLFIDERAGKPVYELSAINKDGEVDDDANATAFVLHPETELFSTKLEAARAFQTAMCKYIVQKFDYIQKCIAEVDTTAMWKYIGQKLEHIQKCIADELLEKKR